MKVRRAKVVGHVARLEKAAVNGGMVALLAFSCTASWGCIAKRQASVSSVDGGRTFRSLCGPDVPAGEDLRISFKRVMNNAVENTGLIRFELGAAPAHATVCVMPEERRGEALALEFPLSLPGRHFVVSGGRSVVTLPVLGLFSGKGSLVSVRVTDATGKVHSAQDFPVPAVAPHEPEFALPRLEPVPGASALDRVQAGFVLLDPRRKSQNVPGTFAAQYGMFTLVDHDFNLRWVYRGNARIGNYQFLPNGNIVYISDSAVIREVDMLGNVVRQWHAGRHPNFLNNPPPQSIPVDVVTFHHALTVVPKPDGTVNIAALSVDAREVPGFFTNEETLEKTPEKQVVAGDRIVEFNAAGQIVRDWSALDHMDLGRLGRQTFSEYWPNRGLPFKIDWTHANNIVYLPKTQRLLASFRVQSAITMIDWGTSRFGEIQWIAGNPQGWSEAFRGKLLKSGATEWFWHQHGATFDDDKEQLLVFNNDNYHGMAFEKPIPVTEGHSHSEIWQIDNGARTMERIWTPADFKNPNQQLVSIAMGSTQRLPNQNVLSSYGDTVESSKLASVNWVSGNNTKLWTSVREFAQSGELLWGFNLRPSVADEARDPTFGWTLFRADHIGSSLSPMGTVESIVARNLWESLP